MEIQTPFRSRSDSRGTSEDVPSTPALALISAGLLVVGCLVTTAPAAAQVATLPPTAEEMDRWFASPEGQRWVSDEFREERTACLMMEGRVDILAAVVEQLLASAPSEEDGEDLRTTRRVLDGETVRVRVERGAALSAFERSEIGEGDVTDLGVMLHEELVRRNLPARPGQNVEGLPRSADDGSRFVITLTHPSSSGLWISTTVDVTDTRSETSLFSGGAHLVQMDGIWRFVEWGPRMVRHFGADDYEPFQCPQ